jgi:hypothetical protein
MLHTDTIVDILLLLFMVRWVPISVTLCKRAVLMPWHAFVFLELRLSNFLLFAWWSPLLFG